VRDATLLDLLGEATSERQSAIVRREQAKTSLGNLTLLHYGINRGLQNREFVIKRQKMFDESNLHLNRLLMKLSKWDEEDIAARALKLFEVAIILWPGPT
jgi:hypothetical protein